MAEAFDGSQKVVCGLGPFEGLRIFIVHVDEDTDVGLELAYRDVDTSLDRVLVSSANQRSTWLIHDAEVGVRWT
jgi:hypothetical protein